MVRMLWHVQCYSATLWRDFRVGLTLQLVELSMKEGNDTPAVPENIGVFGNNRGL